MEVKSLEGLNNFLSTPRNIFITTHYKPDGDAIGSTLGLYHFLRALGHKATVVVPSSVPDFLHWMPDVEYIVNFEENAEQVKQLLVQSEIIFCLDFNKFERVQGMSALLSEAAQTKVLIDHHLEPKLELFQYVYSSPEKSSTAEMVYDFIQYMGQGEILDAAMMQCIYTGMMTDTGSFAFPATSASVHEIISDFKRRGFKHSYVHEAVYSNWSLERMKFMGYLFYQKLVVDPQAGYGYIFISKKDLENFHAGLNDTEGLVNMILSIRSVKVAVLITERDFGIKLSFRSKGNIDVNTFARQYFSGGGHFNAAGGSFQAGWNQLKPILEQRLPELIKSSEPTNDK